MTAIESVRSFILWRLTSVGDREGLNLFELYQVFYSHFRGRILEEFSMKIFCIAINELIKDKRVNTCTRWAESHSIVITSKNRLEVSWAPSGWSGNWHDTKLVKGENFQPVDG